MEQKSPQQIYTHQQTYSSLHKHVHSILGEDRNRNFFQLYSSNQQPKFPSILQRSRTKKSHQKSLRKGISRVSQSKPKIQDEKQQQKERGTGTLLNFNIQDVVQSKYHIIKPHDQILEKGDGKGQKSKQDQNNDKIRYGSNEKSLIDEYRIITYVPSYQVVSNQNKQNSLNESNINKIHNKNESESVQIINPSPENVLELNTWRTSQNFDPYYSKNYGTELNQTDAHQTGLQHNRGYSSLEQKQYDPSKFSLSLNRIDKNRQNDPQNSALVGKIKHLQKLIVQIERQKNSLIQQNRHLSQETQQFRLENEFLKKQNLSMKQQSVRNQKILSQFRQAMIQTSQKTKLNVSPFKRSVYMHDQIGKDQVIQNQSSKMLENSGKSVNKSSLYEFQNQLVGQIESLELINAKISKELSQKCLQTTELNKKNKNLSQTISEIQKQIKRFQQKIENQEQKLYRKDEKINFLSLEVDRLNILIKQRQQNVQPHRSHQYKTTEYEKGKIQQETIKHQKSQPGINEELQEIKEKYDKVSRDFSHLQKKYNFMKDELDHLKYLQHNTSSASISHSAKKYQTLNKQNQKQYQKQQVIGELQKKVQILQQTLRQGSEYQLKLRQNFRALQELFVKEQDKVDQAQYKLHVEIQQNKNLRLDLEDLEQLLNAQTTTIKEPNESLRFLDNEEALFRLRKDHSSLEHKYEILKKQVIILQRQKDQLGQKYLEQLQKSTLLSKRHNQNIQNFAKTLQKEEKQKTSIIVSNYEQLIQKLNTQITLKKQDLIDVKAKHIQQIKRLQQDFEKSLDKIVSEQKQMQMHRRNGLHENNLKRNDLIRQNQKQNSLRLSRSLGRHNSSHHVNSSNQNNVSLNRSRKALHSMNCVQIPVNLELMNRKDLQVYTINLHQEHNLLENRHKKLMIQAESLQDAFQQSSRHLLHLQQEIIFYKENKQNSLKQKLQLCQQLQKVNSLLRQIKRTNTPLLQENTALKSKLKQADQKNLSSLVEKQSCLKDLKILKQRLVQRDDLLDRNQRQLRQIRICILEQQQRCQKYIKELTVLDQQKEAHRSKQEYYKMLLQKQKKEFQTQLKQKQALLVSLQTAKTSSPLKRSRNIKQDKKRQVELYRIEIYKDLNQLLGLNLQLYSLEQIIEADEQEYLRRMLNAVKQQIKKKDQLKRLIVDMEEIFKNEKAHIKQDYDLLYEKYLKYKSMCQSMEKDIEKYKFQRTKKDTNFSKIVL